MVTPSKCDNHPTSRQNHNIFRCQTSQIGGWRRQIWKLNVTLIGFGGKTSQGAINGWMESSHFWSVLLFHPISSRRQRDWGQMKWRCCPTWLLPAAAEIDFVSILKWMAWASPSAILEVGWEDKTNGLRLVLFGITFTRVTHRLSYLRGLTL